MHHPPAGADRRELRRLRPGQRVNARGCEPTAGHPPTVPVTHTTEPVSLLDLFNIFNLPTRQRLMVIINELGIGTSGRGQDFNDVLRRANPALALARQAIGILTTQKAQLATLVDATNTVATEAAEPHGQPPELPRPRRRTSRA